LQTSGAGDVQITDSVAGKIWALQTNGGVSNLEVLRRIERAQETGDLHSLRTLLKTARRIVD
jgi:hypothetical protein